MDALRWENPKLKMRVKAKDKEKKKETSENIVSVNKVSSHQLTVKENEGESNYKTRGLTNSSLAVEGAH